MVTHDKEIPQYYKKNLQKNVNRHNVNIGKNGCQIVLTVSNGFFSKEFFQEQEYSWQLTLMEVDFVNSF